MVYLWLYHMKLLRYLLIKIYKGYKFRILRKLGKDDIDKIWTIAMVEIDTLMTREVEA